MGASEIVDMREKRKSNGFISFLQDGIPLAFLLTFLIICLRGPASSGVPFLWAEDAAIFLQRSIDSGLTSIFEPSNSYFHVIPQILTWLCYSISSLFGLGIVYVPYMMKFTAIALEAGMLCYFVSDSFTWVIRDKQIRVFIVVLATLLLPAKSYEVWHTLTNFQWWAGILLYYVGLKLLNERDIPTSIPLTVFLFFVGFSTPYGVITVAMYGCLLLYRLFCTKSICQFFTQNITGILFSFFLFLPAVIQALSSLARQNSKEAGSLLGHVQTFIYLSLGRITTVFNSNWYFSLEIINIIIGIGILAAIFLLATNKRFIVISYVFYFLFFLTNAFALPNHQASRVLNRMSYTSHGRYYFTPHAVLIFVVIIALYQRCAATRSEAIKQLLVGISATVFLFGALQFTVPIRHTMVEYFKSQAPYFDKNGSDRVYIPSAWHFNYGLEMPFTLDSSALDTKGCHMHIDSVVEIDSNFMIYQITGWFIDQENGEVAEEMLLDVGDGIYYPGWQVKREDVGEAFGEEYTMGGFGVTVRGPQHLIDTPYDEWKFVFLTDDREYCYQMSYTYEDKLEPYREIDWWELIF